MTTIFTYHAFGFTRGAGGIEDVEQVSAFHRGAVNRCCLANGLLPIHVASVYQAGLRLRTLKDNAVFGFVFCQVNGFV